MARTPAGTARCKGCGKTGYDVGGLSGRYLCPDCGYERVRENAAQMHARSGPYWAKWRRNMAACVGGLLLDDMPANGNTEPHAR